MTKLFADATTTDSSIMPHQLGESLVVSLIFLLVAVAVFPLLWKFIDWMTPGNLNKELLGDNTKGQPNLALAVVVAAMVLGFSVIIAAAIH